MLGFTIYDTHGYKSPWGDLPWGVWCHACPWRASYETPRQMYQGIDFHLYACLGGWLLDPIIKKPS